MTPVTLEVFQGEAADPFANHRLKSFWEITTRTTRMTAQALADWAITRLEYEVSDGCSLVTFDGDPVTCRSSRSASSPEDPPGPGGVPRGSRTWKPSSSWSR